MKNFDHPPRVLRYFDAPTAELRLIEEMTKSLANLLAYFGKHQSRMNYRLRLSQGRSIGSGQVEGACKNLIARRLKQTDTCWLKAWLNKMATLCAIRYSELWNSYWGDIYIS